MTRNFNNIYLPTDQIWNFSIAQNNLLTKPDHPNSEYHIQGSIPNVHFGNIIENPLESDWRDEKTKQRCSIFTEDDYDNFAACQIDILIKLMTEIDKDQVKVLFMIFDMKKTYMEYLDQGNKPD